MDNTTATCIILTRSSDKPLRKRSVTSFEEVLAMHKEFPKHDIAIFEDPTGKTGEMWSYYPEVQDPKFWR